MKILVTGGAGYIGTHICVELLSQDYQIVIIDNLINSSFESLEKVSSITGKKIIVADKGKLKPDLKDANFIFINSDINDRDALQFVFQNQKIQGVIHLAGFKAVAESVRKPLDYYNNNVTGSIILFDEMAKAGVETLIFSSSATVYGNPESLPIDETSQTMGSNNPYGNSKLFIEIILKDLSKINPNWRISLLRYFNPVGAHPSGLIGEAPKGLPNNLMPYICQVAAGKLKKLKIYGNNYPTSDGTGIRDYIHVVDLAKGHLATLDYLLKNKSKICIFNLGTGKGTSVLEMLAVFEKVTGKSIPFEITKKREGDVAECWASSELANKELGWKAKYDINKICEDAWRWQKNNL